MLKIGMLTSGGDCQALNATMRAIYKSVRHAADEPVEFYGFEDGYKGLMYGKYRILQQSDFNGILTIGGTILGTSRVPFKKIRKPDENGIDKVKAMKHTYKQLDLDCLVVLGRQRLDQDGQLVVGRRTQRGGDAENDRQRLVGNGHDVRIPVGGRYRDARH